jgi:hypothetical protein
MNIWLASLIALLAFTTGIAFFYALIVRKALAAAKVELKELQTLCGQKASDGAAATEPYIRMLVEVKNPIALAHRESPVSKLASGAAPNLVIKKVYEQVVAQTKDQLREKNVDADVSIIVL